MPPIWLFSLFLASFVIGTDDMVIAGLLPVLAADLGTTEATAGQLVTAFSLTYAVGAPVMAVLTARWPRRTVLLVGLAAFVLANVLASVAPTYGVLLALRVGAASAAATLTPACLTVVADLASPERRGRYLGIVTAGLTVSLVIGVPTGTWVGGTLGWRSTFLLVAGLAAVALAGVSRSVPHLSAAPRLTLRERLGPLTRREISLPLTGLVASGAGGMMTYVYLAPLAARLADVATGRLAVLIAIFGLAGAAGTALGGALADRTSAVRAVAVTFGGTCLAAVGLLSLSLAAPVPFPVLMVALAAYGLFVWSVSPPVQVHLLGLAGPHATSVLALNISAMYAGFTLAGAIGGVSLQVSGVSGLLTTATVLLTIGTGIVIHSVRRETRRCASVNWHAGPGSPPGPCATTRSTA